MVEDSQTSTTQPESSIVNQNDVLSIVQTDISNIVQTDNFNVDQSAISNVDQTDVSNVDQTDVDNVVQTDDSNVVQTDDSNVDPIGTLLASNLNSSLTLTPTRPEDDVLSSADSDLWKEWKKLRSINHQHSFRLNRKKDKQN